MSSDIAIKVNNVSKSFQIYEKPIDRLKQSFFGGRKQFYDEFKVLNNISFEVKKGETVGIIGRNGSGKSTLLQMICGTLTPTSGDISLIGRVAALLELGAGFNPEFTGRENIYMNAAILGLDKNEIKERYAAILEFSGIGDFINQPVKTYSSGMYVRLAFSVAINVDPDILIVDEALSVGDMLFQAKCMLKLKELVDKGVTVLFVSHDTHTVKGLCQKCVFLDSGQMVGFGKASDVVDMYIGQMNLDINSVLKNTPQIENSSHETEANLNSPVSEINQLDVKNENKIIVSTSGECSWPDTVHRYGDGGARIIDIKLLDASRRPVSKLELEQRFIIQASIKFEKDVEEFAVGYSFRDLKGQMLVGSVSTSEKVELPSVKKDDVHIVEFIGENKLKAGVYMISLGVELPVERNLHHMYLDVIENAVVFESLFKPDPETWFPAIVRVPIDIHCYKA